MKNLEILLKLINLDPVNTIHDSFSYAQFNAGICSSSKSDINQCLTYGCLAGELPGIDKNWIFHNNLLKYIPSKESSLILDQLVEYFGMPREIILYFFYGCALRNYPDLPSNPTMKQVQEHIKNFLIKNEII